MTDYPFKDRWFYCKLCRTPSIKCEYCGNISCSGGGCEFCHEEFKEANRLVDEGKAPPKEELRVHDIMLLMDVLFNQFENRIVADAKNKNNL